MAKGQVVHGQAMAKGRRG